VAGTPVLVVALVGIVVNLAAVWTLSKANRESMTVEGSFQHILTDLAAFVFTAIAGVVILTTGFKRADRIASLIIAAIIAQGRLFAAEGVRSRVPRGGPARTGSGRDRPRMADHQGVREVHDLHVWEVTSGFPALSEHVLVDAGCDCHDARRRIERTLHDDFHLDHTTLQVDHEAREALLSIQPARSSPSPN
jgi:cobalt-zinc-cadmium efflux system protein